MYFIEQSIQFVWDLLPSNVGRYHYSSVNCMKCYDHNETVICISYVIHRTIYAVCMGLMPSNVGHYHHSSLNCMKCYDHNETVICISCVIHSIICTVPMELTTLSFGHGFKYVELEPGLAN